MTYLVADLPNIGINPNVWTDGLAGAVGPWMAGGLGLGLAVLAVLLGWRKLREIADPASADPYEHYTYDDWIEDAALDYENESAVEAEVAEQEVDLGDAAMEAIENDAEIGDFSSLYGVTEPDYDPEADSDEDSEEDSEEASL